MRANTKDDKNMKLEIYCEETEPYLFASYAHSDKEDVARILRGLIDKYNFRIWFDQGLNEEGEQKFEGVIKKKIMNDNCVGILAFLSKSSMKSKFCGQELALGLGSNKEIVCYGIYHEIEREYIQEKDAFGNVVRDEDGNPKKK